MAAIDKVQICNRGLINIGCNVINSFDDGSNEANACSVIWDQLRREIIGLFPWTFCVKRAQLAASTTNPVFDYSYRYKLPSDYLWVYQVYQDSDYKVEQGGYIITNKASCYVKYVYDNEDPSSWSSDFQGLMATGIAKELAYTFPREVSIDQDFEMEFKNKLMDAQGRDALQQPTDDFGQEASAFLTARFGRYGSSNYNLRT